MIVIALTLLRVKSTVTNFCDYSPTDWQYTAANNCFHFTDGIEWSSSDETTDLATNCNLTEDWAYVQLNLAATELISTMIVLTDFRNSLGI